MKLPPFGRARARLVTSADVSAEIAEHQRLLGDATAALSALDANRAEVLIGDDVGAIREHRTRSDELRITVDRLEARLGALGTQAAEIAAAEVAAALTTQREAAERRASEIAAWWRRAYPEMARLLVGAIQELTAADREIAGVNEKLVAAGRQDEAVQGAEERINPHRWAEPPGGIFLPSVSIAANTRLVELAEIGAPGWGPPLGVPRW